MRRAREFLYGPAPGWLLRIERFVTEPMPGWLTSVGRWVGVLLILYALDLNLTHGLAFFLGLGMVVELRR